MPSSQEFSVVALNVGCMNAEGGGGDILEEEGGEFDGEGEVSFGANFGFGGSLLLLVIVLDHSQTLFEGISSCFLSEDGLNSEIDTSNPYLMA